MRLTDNLQLSVAFLPLLFVAVVFGPLPAALIGAATVLIDFGRPFTRWVIWTANRTLIGGFAGIAAQAAMAHGTNTFGRIIVATSVAAVVDFGLDFVLNGVTLVLRGTGSIRGLARTTGPVALAGIPLYTSLVGVLAYSYLCLRRGAPRCSSYRLSPRNGFSSSTVRRAKHSPSWGKQTIGLSERTYLSRQLWLPRLMLETATRRDIPLQLRSTHETSPLGWALVPASRIWSIFAGWCMTSARWDCLLGY